MKKVLLFLLLTIGTAIGAKAAGPYEIGGIDLGSATCRWTTYTKKSCYKADAQKKIAEFNACIDPQFKAIGNKCRDEACIDKKIDEIAKRCCTKTKGHLVK